MFPLYRDHKHGTLQATVEKLKMDNQTKKSCIEHALG